jgi:anti-sigma factor RsiW
MMSCARYEQELGAYVDGALDPSGALDAHLAACARCRALAADLRAIRTAARTLEPREPPGRVWARLAAAGDDSPRRAIWQRAWAFALARPALSAVGLALVLGLAWVGPMVAPVVAPGGSGTAMAEALPVEVQMAVEQYTREIQGLQEITHAEAASTLDPETADVLHVHVAVIDQAIGETRAVLEAEPGNELALESLFDALRSKLMLLQDMVVLINEMRKGNQEEAARIASELNP